MLTWLALESNPDLFNSWSSKLGLDTSVSYPQALQAKSSWSTAHLPDQILSPQLFSFQDCLGLDPDSLALVSKPVKAVVLLFPPPPNYAATRKEEQERIEREGVEGVEDLLFFKQTSESEFH